MNFSAICGSLWLDIGIWGVELLCSRVVWKSAAIFEWPGLASLSGPQCFGVIANFNKFYVVYFAQDSELLELFHICRFDHFGDILTFIWQCA